MKRILALFLSATVLLGTLTTLSVLGSDTALWKYIDNRSDTVITETADGVYSASREAGGFRIMTTEKFDPRDKKLSVVLGETTGEWFTFGVVGGDGSVSGLGNTQNGIDFIIHTNGYANYYAYVHRNGRQEAVYGDHKVRDFKTAHTFGFNRQDGNWYLTIDGRILNTATVNENINKVLEENSEVYFVIGAQAAAAFTDIEIVENTEYRAWVPLSGEPVISKNQDGAYDLSGNGEIISGDSYDISSYEISFVSAETSDKPLRLGVAARNSDGTVTQKGITAEIKNGECRLGWYGEEGYVELPSTMSIAPDVPHTFGVSNRGGVYYPAVDSNIISFPEEADWQSRQAEFSDFVKSNSEKLSFTFYSESGVSLTNAAPVARKAELIPHKSYQNGYDYSGIVTSQTDNGLTLEGRSGFITSASYDVSKYDLAFKVTNTNSGWINLSVTKSDVVEGINKVLEDPTAPATRVDFLIYLNDGAFCVKNVNEGADSYNQVVYNNTVNALNAAHTFGLREIDGHWYPAIDGVACTLSGTDSAISYRLDKFMQDNGSTALRFAIGGENSIKIENTGIVDNTQSITINNDPNKTGAVANQPNGGVTVSGGNKADFLTVDAYDITEKDFTFTVDDLGNVGTVYLSIAKATGEISKNPGSDFTDPSRIDFKIFLYNNSFAISFDASSDADQSVFNNVSNYLSKNFNNKTHTFGFRNVNGQWYPAIDGFVYDEEPAKEPDAALAFLNRFIEDNGTNLRFGVATNHEITDFTLTNVGVTDILGFAPHTNTVGTAESGENGYTVLSGSKGMFLTTDFYDVTKNDIQFNLTSAPNDYIGLSVTKADFPANISTSFGNDFNNPTRIDFKIYPLSNQLVICFKSTDGSAPQAEFTAASPNLQKSLKTTAHTFGLREIDGHWYPAIDGTAYTVTAKDKQNPTAILDKFMQDNGKLLRFGIGGQNNFVIEAKIIEPNTLWGACSGGGVINKEEDGVTSVDNFYLSVRTNDVFDITQKDVQFNITSYTGDWVRFGLAAANDSKTLGEAREFIARFGKNAAFSYLLNGTEARIANVKFDLNTVHTFGVRYYDGHWYPAVDGEIFYTKSNESFDAFIEANKENGFRFVLGAHNYFSATDMKVIDSVPSELRVPKGWDIYPGHGGGSFEGNEQDGYSRQQTGGVAFAYTNAKYDMRTTSLSFNLADVGDFIYFCVSTGDASQSGALPVGPDPNRFVFILRPVASHVKLQLSNWNDGSNVGKERVITIKRFNWFDKHTIDVRQVGENWFICVDGIIYQSKVLSVFNEFMNSHIDEGLHYGFGASGSFDVSEVKIINQVPLSKESEFDFQDGTLDDAEIDWGFDFGNDANSDLTFEDDAINDVNNNGDFSFNDVDNNFSFTDGDNNLSFTDGASDGESAETSQKIIGRMKKKRLVSAGHGYIFEWYEITGMILGGVLLLGGITTGVVIIIRRKKNKSKFE